MGTLSMAVSGLMFAALLVFSGPHAWNGGPVGELRLSLISTTELTLAAGSLETPEYHDAH
jgi:hypothetical protein